MSYIMRRILYDLARSLIRKAMKSGRPGYTQWAREFCESWQGSGALAIDALLANDSAHAAIDTLMEAEYARGAKAPAAAGRVYSSLWRR